MKKYILSLAGLINPIFSNYGIINTAYHVVNQHAYRNNCLHELAGHGNPNNKQVAEENYFLCLFKWAQINNIAWENVKKNDYLNRDKNLMLNYSHDTFNLYNSHFPINKKTPQNISVRIFN
jgi:hypothetical protein